MVKQRKAGTARTRAPAIPPADVGVVEQELGRHRRLERYRVVAKGRQLIVQEPLTGLDAELAERAALHGVTAERLAAALGPPRYTPVLRFVVIGGGEYRVERMTYRGEGGWSHPLDCGSIGTLAKKYIPVLGTEEFFELY